MIETARVMEGHFEPCALQHQCGASSDFWLPRSAVSQSIKLGCKPTEVVHGFRLRRRHDCDVPRLPVRRNHENSFDSHHALTEPFELEPKRARFDGKRRRAVRDEKNRCLHALCLVQNHG